MTALHGVNLGGWFVLEKWMTPTLFKDTGAVDEYTYSQDAARHGSLQTHRDTFITEEDFTWLKDNGLKLIRIPVGYWIFGGEPPYVGCIEKLDWAFEMAKKYELQILISMHGAPGSQNGHDHSGQIGKARWYDDVSHQTKTIDVLEKLARRYGDHPSLWGIQLLNEPRLKLFQGTLRRFYRDAYAALDPSLPGGIRLVYHDAFTPRLLSGALFNRPERPVIMDTHWYHFGAPLAQWLPLSIYYWLVASHGRLLRRLRKDQPIMVGEWSGVFQQNIYNRTPKQDHGSLNQHHIKQQQKAYESAEAWCYWSYKTEKRGIWHFRSLVEDGYLKV